MVSKTNKTGYDDTLFFRCIPNAIKTLFTLPVDAPFAIKNKAPESSNYEISAVKIETTHCRPVYNSATGTVCAVTVQENTTKSVLIKHQCSLYSRYDNLVDCNLKADVKVAQGQQIAQTGKDENGFGIQFSLLIDINEILFNQKADAE